MRISKEDRLKRQKLFDKGKKKCCICSKIKVLSKFGSLKASYDGMCPYCKLCVNKRAKVWTKENSEHCKNNMKKYHKQLKIDCINAYGKKCKCCGESNIEFLSIEHTNGDGKQHRKKLKNMFGTSNMYYTLKRLGYPEDAGLQVLCYNCNCSKEFYGYCPHKQKSQFTKEREVRK